MLKMLSEMGLYAAGALLLGYLVYSLFFAERTGADAQEKKKHRRLDRREGDRRRDKNGVPPDGIERRKDFRRTGD